MAKPTCLLCTCGDSQPLDMTAIGAALGDPPPSPASMLCRNEIGRLRDALRQGDNLLVTCEQEAATFEAVAEADGYGGRITFTDIRDQAGWSDEAGAAAPKMAALIAAAADQLEPPPAIEISSDGACIVYGAGDVAFEAARRLAGRLDVTLIMTSGLEDVLIPPRAEFALVSGRIKRLAGGLGGFEATLMEPRRWRPTSRSEPATDRGEETITCDIVVDLSGGTPLVQAPQKHDGYLRADPGDPAAVALALFEAADLVGSFDKPRYIDFTADLCAHSRSKRTGCTRCLMACPTGAITPAGDHVAIDPVICAGCGSCASLCPTGAASYQAPRPGDLGRKLRTLLKTYHAAQGKPPVLLIMDDRHGRPLVSALARHGDGLPAAVLPLTLQNVGQFGLDMMLAAMAFGASRVVFLCGPELAGDLIPLETGISYANTILAGLGFGDDRITLLAEEDPDRLRSHLEDALADMPEPIHADYLPLGGKRDRLRLGLDALHDKATSPVDVIAMPEDAPFGTVKVDADGCTLCLACVGACPTGALIDNPDQPMLRFIEDACVQCGLCRNTCPESVITLEPRVNFRAEAKSPRLIKEEQPFECVRCGKAFGTRSSVERIIEKLSGKHWMFQDSKQVERIRMCDDCRVAAQFESGNDPFAMGERPKTKTTDDYLREREEIEAARRALKKDDGEV